MGLGSAGPLLPAQEWRSLRLAGLVCASPGMPSPAYLTALWLADGPHLAVLGNES